MAAGRHDLHAAIARCGGFQKLAEHLQLPYAETRGRRKRSQAAVKMGEQQGDLQHRQQQREQELLQPAFLAARLRPPPCALHDGPQPVGVNGKAAGARRGLTGSPRPQDPATRLLERELVLEAYTDTTFV